MKVWWLVLAVALTACSSKVTVQEVVKTNEDGSQIVVEKEYPEGDMLGASLKRILRDTGIESNNYSLKTKEDLVKQREKLERLKVCIPEIKDSTTRRYYQRWYDFFVDETNEAEKRMGKNGEEEAHEKWKREFEAEQVRENELAGKLERVCK